MRSLSPEIIVKSATDIPKLIPTRVLNLLTVLSLSPVKNLGTLKGSMKAVEIMHTKIVALVLRTIFDPMVPKAGCSAACMSASKCNSSTLCYHDLLQFIESCVTGFILMRRERK